MAPFKGCCVIHAARGLVTTCVLFNVLKLDDSTAFGNLSHGFANDVCRAGNVGWPQLARAAI
jgi:hypothetical protein